MFPWRMTACKRVIPAKGELMDGVRGMGLGMMAPFLSQVLEFSQ